MTAEGGLRLAAEEAPAAGWLEERWHVDVGHLVEVVEVYPSASSHDSLYTPQKARNLV